MAAAYVQNHASVRLARKKARALLQTAFVQALHEAKISHAAAARSIRVNKSTIARWIHLRSRIDVEAVLASPKLGERFRRALCVHDHAAHEQRLAYLARKHPSVTRKRRATSRRGRT